MRPTFEICMKQHEHDPNLIYHYIYSRRSALLIHIWRFDIYRNNNSNGNNITCKMVTKLLFYQHYTPISSSC